MGGRIVSADRHEHRWYEISRAEDGSGRVIQGCAEPGCSATRIVTR
jgi:hypothetical protein